MINTKADYLEELQFAIESSKKAGIVIMGYASKKLVVTKKGKEDVSSAADFASNAKLTELISTKFPEDAILSEDRIDDKTRLRNSRVWIIDPLDGTKNFIEYAGTYKDQFKYFGVHIGFVVDGNPILGVVYCPTTNELFFAERGHGAFLKNNTQENRLCVRDKQLGEMRFSLAPSVYRNKGLVDFVRGVEGSSSNAGYVFGYPVVGIAKGNHDAYIAFPTDSRKIGEWDVCAPGLILEEAGGKITDLQGNPFKFNQDVPYISTGVCASNNMAHDQLIEKIKVLMK